MYDEPRTVHSMQPSFSILTPSHVFPLLTPPTPAVLPPPPPPPLPLPHRRERDLIRDNQVIHADEIDELRQLNKFSPDDFVRLCGLVTSGRFGSRPAGEGVAAATSTKQELEVLLYGLMKRPLPTTLPDGTPVPPPPTVKGIPVVKYHYLERALLALPEVGLTGHDGDGDAAKSRDSGSGGGGGDLGSSGGMSRKDFNAAGGAIGSKRFMTQQQVVALAVMLDARTKEAVEQALHSVYDLYSVAAADGTKTMQLSAVPGIVESLVTSGQVPTNTQVYQSVNWVFPEHIRLTPAQMARRAVGELGIELPPAMR